jgi:AmmeMemoRadiSam system protein B
VNIRKRGLPEGWYPSTAVEIRALSNRWESEFRIRAAAQKALAGIVPHAGWTFCGDKIAEVLMSLVKDVETLVILGGHNPPGGSFLEYAEDAWDLPSGRLYRDSELGAAFQRLLPEDFISAADMSTDNTVEVIMPLVATLFPDAQWLAWRLPADKRSIRFGKILAEAVGQTGRRVGVIGSTDLTHYGPNYGFSPSESLDSPEVWVKERDRRILKAVTGFDSERVLELAQSERSACSAGAAVGAMAFAEESGCRKGLLKSYSTSRDIYPSSSFVGYGSVIWESG